MELDPSFVVAATHRKVYPWPPPSLNLPQDQMANVENAQMSTVCDIQVHLRSYLRRSVKADVDLWNQPQVPNLRSPTQLDPDTTPMMIMTPPASPPAQRPGGGMEIQGKCEVDLTWITPLRLQLYG
ncbi:hypothetical protein FRB96_002906 [Tulasnella sp. 330]|nr:hypothetical protein FRB96_002906 [Tulasnella sp. 330]KAG8884363.1 hypothetical protein FRB98_002442 [Tulasnella sp. 332]